MRYLQLGRLSLLKQRHQDNLQLAEDLEIVMQDVPINEEEDERVRREAAEERVLAMMREENFGPIGQSSRKVHLAKAVDCTGCWSSWQDGLSCGVS